MRPIYKLALSLSLAIGLSHSAAAATDAKQLRVVGLFKDTAIISMGQQTRTLRVGQAGPANIQLIEANAREAVFRINGTRVRHALSDNSVIQLAPSRPMAETRVWASNGMYRMHGSINGQLVSFVMDTGATYISLGRSEAEALGIDYESGETALMDTANGQTVAHLVKLKTVSVGEIEVHNVTAAILENLPRGKILLGMSFLQNVELHNRGQVMLLRQRSR